MKTIKDFLDKKIDAGKLPFFRGGKEYLTSMMGENCSDTWYDNDDDGKRWNNIRRRWSLLLDL